MGGSDGSSVNKIGDADGLGLGPTVGSMVINSVGSKEGATGASGETATSFCKPKASDGAFDIAAGGFVFRIGDAFWLSVGSMVTTVGPGVCGVGGAVGFGDGAGVGRSVGVGVGLALGDVEGFALGWGLLVGLPVGAALG